MSKHFRVSGSSFQKLEEFRVRVPAVLRRAGLPFEFSNHPSSLRLE
jgi:hypothetical protein